MFHIVYTRSYYDREHEGGHFDNSWTVLRNVPYSRLDEFNKEFLAEKKVECDAYYKMNDENRMSYDEIQIDKDQCFHSSCYIVDDEDYLKTYKDMYPDSYISGYVDEDKDYFYNYGQDCEFMVQQDYKNQQKGATNLTNLTLDNQINS